MATEKKRLAITMGDAAGIGPEVIVRAWSDPRIHAFSRPVVLGHPQIMQQAVELLGAKTEVVEDNCESGPATMPCLPIGDDNVLSVAQGTVDPRTGQAAYEALIRAIDETLAGRFDGIVTAPLSKAALHAAGHFYPGHTELLAERCGVTDFAMMLYLPPQELPNSPAGLGVVHVTLHMALSDVFANLSSTAIVEKCHLAQQVMHEGFGLAAPRIGVCALNPHGGESGLFGDEESRIISPAVDQAQAAGINATGPFPTDTLMVRARDGEFDAIVAMYHDQGHIALKLLGMHRAVNITLGLPIVRTSVAHGTAFDRAWQGTAEATGMVAAITTAAKLARK
ncbi:4-hydroxythreonine-4-phosphate dehydrogenase PdxA [Bythopirellula polymerisocia]|uniref:4-hydroxythreonine-4-phosphate dehydrogenase n=1 Tax=Bythopirellula polymerisocia TaxID=2528003 RepID=A0A5C6CK37_9BACT|nr:4-hydroxythreonine-4-phosphate dehydrogenase PdxA [Bythopirellula polymerisocia]TWU24465.1 4-hydroxythreonine-4-phosphate dehydrogenase [Bythopirellula polymerisocia]